MRGRSVEQPVVPVQASWVYWSDVMPETGHGLRFGNKARVSLINLMAIHRDGLTMYSSIQHSEPLGPPRVYRSRKRAATGAGTPEWDKNRRRALPFAIDT